MYERFFGLTEPPFSIAPDPRYLYMSEKHREALAHLLYGITNGGFVLLTGEVGTGKTTICRCVLEQLPTTTELAFVFNPKLTAAELLEALCDEFRIDVRGEPAAAAQQLSIKTLIDRINAHLLAQHARGRTCVLIIDEAQNLDADVLEQMRLLTNLETNERKLLQIMMIGQPELRTILKRPDLRQLAQRITARYHLGPLSAADVAAYVAHRLQVAGVERPLFPPPVLKRLYRHSGGVPRLINLIADRALLGAYVKGEIKVTAQTLDRAADEILDRTPANTPRRHRRLAMAAGSAGIVAAAAAAVLIAPNGVEVLTGVRDRAQAVWQAAIAGPNGIVGGAGNGAGHGAGATAVAMSSPADETTAATATPATRAPVPVAPPTETVSTDGAEAKAETKAETVQAKPHDGDVAAAPIMLARAVVDPAEPAMASASPGDTASLAVTPPEATSFDTLDWPPGVPPEAGERLAYRAVLARWGIAAPAEEGDPCAVAAAEGLSCLEEVGTLARLASLDRPAVLKLKDRQGRMLFAALVGLTPSTATVELGGVLRRVALADLVQDWRGAYTVIWRMPPGYRYPIGAGAEGDAVAWIAKRVNAYAGQAGAAPQRAFDAALRDQLRHFQSMRQLTADGIAGPLTLIALDAATDRHGPRLTAAGL